MNSFRNRSRVVTDGVKLEGKTEQGKLFKAFGLCEKRMAGKEDLNLRPLGGRFNPQVQHFLKQEKVAYGEQIQSSGHPGAGSD